MQATIVTELDFAPVSKKQILTAAFASILGFALDLFDLYLLLYVAPVIGKLFFPSASPTLSLAAVYASFAVSLLMRPIGSALFGSYGDRNGRKAAMLVAFVGVGISTAAFGFLPTIVQVGEVATIIFLLLRLVQGVFVGGVVASTHTIATETVPPNWRGSMSGLIGGGSAAVGALLASIVFWVTSYFFPGDAFEVWGWRCMFFSGILSAILGFLVFNALEETPFFKKLEINPDLRAAKAHAPLRILFSSEYRSIFLTNLLVTCGAGVAYYLTSGYMPTFIKIVNHVPYGDAAAILIGCSISGFLGSLIAGHVSTMIGRKPAMITFGLATALTMPLGYLALGNANDLMLIAALAIALTFLGNMPLGPVLIFLNERFPTRIRASGTGLSWNVGFAFGGTMPTFVSLFSKGIDNVSTSLALFLFGGSILFLIGAFIVPETKGKFQ
jgi:MFS transporter, MHS family, proline/betaine transporter